MSQDHWLELFRFLKMPKGTTLEKLTFGDVLEVSDLIVTHADALKVGPLSFKTCKGFMGQRDREGRGFYRRIG